MGVDNISNSNTLVEENVKAVSLRFALEERYLAYALSTIKERAIPDLRDGFKPVHRRIIHAMSEMGLDFGAAFKKSARIVGEVIGKLHPHGDQSVYDSLVRLAQPFVQRYPLISGQGNFGNIDGDSAAAYRYTEARMTQVAELILQGVDEDAVDFRDTYNEEDSEPVVFPSKFPNLLANGTSGIAVGMATSIPSHNVQEICEAALALIDNPEISIEKLLEYIIGPDFPTGGIIVESRESIVESYRLGRGGFRVRARWCVEEVGRGSWCIVVTEIPYQVQKSRLIEKIAELIIAKRIPLLEDIRDESAEDVRIVLFPKNRSLDPDLLMESIFMLSDMETRFPLNMNVLSMGRVPQVMPLDGILKEWLAHRREVLFRRSSFRMQAIDRRVEILKGLLIAYLNIDEIIAIIRNEDKPKPVMVSRFSLTENQVDAILNLRLRSLRKLEEYQIKSELDNLLAEKEKIDSLLNSGKQQWNQIACEIREVKEIFSKSTDLGRRRTTFCEVSRADKATLQQAMIEKEPITVVISNRGWIRSLKSHSVDLSALHFKEGDSLKIALHAHTTDRILLLSTDGKAYTLPAGNLLSGRGHGEAIQLLIDLNHNQDIVTAFVYDSTCKLLVVSSKGNAFIVEESEIIANTRKGKTFLKVSSEEKMKLVVKVTGDHVAVVGENRKLLIFSIDQIPEMSRGKGVRLQSYKDGGISDVICFKICEGLTWIDSAGRSYNRSENDLLGWLGKRGGVGSLVPKGFPRSGKFLSS
ncbi:DNA topoisomerase IV subunit A [Candidatus Liberibacter asiaticus]|uniref:DNA topoisomerase 4 subunit A n=1 Tax=Liberibacter asiaticus (strain psy62) TaxID=537021 RepID=C6XHT3_LIBAP|nr:DNA topoisomerase IV subunit A [Candidatus Liberibacter asiaticus]ACT56826.1 DNA topoisomerase IV subunit A [Candidatus Liberibacter asiaticus str. psy62]KAE9510490.1 DNA topoisomerase 4 subunit A [Candidatus Liberibacter asiaticus]KAE9511196.1 DNA topoisomerase 4 subunit A [Candidatus Liberibacter asiaticus]KAE9512563.1 DNA topoisomerase 4 subunit A [Candidatus Liberibacter asiaticus]KAE9513645.1 DNA topoisomerase 4 subunit A [Candidatus Liberibacter asiaticus]